MLDEGVLIRTDCHLLEQFVGKGLSEGAISGDMAGEFVRGVVEELLVDDLRDGSFIKGGDEGLDGINTA